MRKLSVLFVLCTIGLTLQAQTLQFSKVLLISSTQDTVPQGKVWKIEALLPYNDFISYNSNNCTSGDSQNKIFINGNQHYVNGYYYTGSSGSTSLAGGRTLPFWLPSGTMLRTQCSQTILSIIEFTIVP